MLRKAFVLAGIGILLLTTSGFGQKTELKWKFKKDDAFYQMMETVTEQTMNVQGAEKVNQTQRQTFYFKWTAKEVDDKAGTVTLQQEIIGLKVYVQIGATVIEYDSQDKEKKSGGSLKDFFESLENAEFTVKVNVKTGKVESVGGHEALKTALTKNNPQMKELLDVVLSEQALKEMAEPTFASIPGVEKAKSDKWKHESKLDMGPIGVYDKTYNYELKEVKDKKATLSVKTDLKYTQPAGNQAKARLPFVIQEAKLTATDGTGNVTFNVDTGRLEESDLSLKLNGTMKIEIGGQTTTVTLDQKQTTKTKSFKDEPLKKK